MDKGFLKRLGLKDGVVDKVMAEIEKMQDENKVVKENYDKALRDMKLSHAVDSALSKANAKNIKATKALLDMGKITFDGDDIVGLNDQIEALMDDKSAGFLFGDKIEPVINGVKPAESVDNVSDVRSEYERAKLAFEKKPTFENSVALSRAKIESEN